LHTILKLQATITKHCVKLESGVIKN